MTHVSARLTMSFVAYFFLLLAVVSATGIVLRRQHDDGLVVNLSGRQRMLTQRMTHQLLTYATRVENGADATDARVRVHGTMRVFETTLAALAEGGPAPIDLQMASFREVPPASHAVAARLGVVRGIYERYRKAADGVVGNDPYARTAGVEAIVAVESDLLAEMDAAVTLLQREAEGKVSQLFFIQGAALLAGLLLTFMVVRWVQRGIVEPLEKLRDAAEEMSLGNLHKAVALEGAFELRSLAESFDRMRTSLRSVLTNRQHDAIAAEIADW